MSAYVYDTFRLTAPPWDQLAELAQSAPTGVLGVFRGEIGVGSDEGVVLATAGASIELGGTVAALEHEDLTSTVRPAKPARITESGVYAHRRFELAEADWEEFLALSQAAWPDFEAVNDGCRIIGLWRAPEPAAGVASALLITRYPSLAAWERSRPYAAQPVDEDKLDAWIAAREAFRRRGELTRRTVVRTYRLL